MDGITLAIFRLVGKQYEIHVYERSRRARVAAQRSTLRLDIDTDEEANARLDAKIALLENILNNIAKLGEL